MKFKMSKGSMSEALQLGGGVIASNFANNLVRKGIEKVAKTDQYGKFSPIGTIILAEMFLKGKKVKMIKNGIVAGSMAKLAGNFVPALAGIEDMDLSGIFDMRIGQTLNDEVRVGDTLNDDMSDDVSGYGDY